MKKWLLLLLFIIPYGVYGQQETPTDQGWYWDTTLRGSWNFAGVCYKNKIYYRKALHREKNGILFQSSHIEAGIEVGLAPFVKTALTLSWQPILPIKFNFKVGYYKDLIGEAIVDGPNGEYNQGYLSFTGLNPGGPPPDRINPDTIEIEFSPTLTLGGIVGPGALALVYIPYMHYFYSFNMDPNQFRHFALYSVVLKQQDILWKHTFIFGYSLPSIGLMVGASGTIQHIQSGDGIFRAGVFGVIGYEQAVKNKPHLIPYVRAQLGTWIKDRYLEKLFVIQVEVGLKYKFK